MKIDIDKILEKQNKTRYWLAQQTQITYPNIKNLCDNKTTSIKFKTLGKICLILNCKPNDILVND